MELYPNLIPHTDFHKGIWVSSNNTPWYYFLKTNREFNIPNHHQFYNTVDENLLPIVKLLHKNGIVTTPSCAGHHESESHYSDLYDSLANNANLINKKGDILYDYENFKKYYYKNPDYRLPWPKDRFVDKIMEYQKNGVLGIVDPDQIFVNNLNNTNTKTDGDITLILTQSENPKDNKEIWYSIYNELISFF